MNATHEQLQALDSALDEARAAEIAAIAAMREKFSHLARYGEKILISFYSFENSDVYRTKRLYLLSPDTGRPVHGLLAVDDFIQPTDRVLGSYKEGRCTGTRLFLAESGWVELVRDGDWSKGPRADHTSWCCGQHCPDDMHSTAYQTDSGSVNALSDADVAEKFDLREITDKLGYTIKKLDESLPERMTNIRRRAAAAASVLAALTADEAAAHGE